MDTLTIVLITAIAYSVSSLAWHTSKRIRKEKAKAQEKARKLAEREAKASSKAKRAA